MDKSTVGNASSVRYTAEFCHALAKGPVLRRRLVLHGRAPASRPQLLVKAITGDIMEFRARQFYERAWAGELELMDQIVAEEHAQRDMIWQKEPRIGRGNLKKGIRYFRSIYPDIKFTVQTIAASLEGQKALVQWSMSGTFEGNSEVSSGVSVMTFNSEGCIAETQVYRQALPAEVALAQRSKRVEPVEQGILLEQGLSSQ